MPIALGPALTRLRFGRSLRRVGMVRRLGACWPWRRFTRSQSDAGCGDRQRHATLSR